jgi:hypothetical protein
MADAIFGATQTDAVKMELITSVVQRELIEGAVVAPRALNVSQFAEAGLKSIEFPKAGSLTIVNRAEGVAGDAAVIPYLTDKMDLNFNAYVAWIVDYKSAVQSRVSTQLDLAARAARAHAAYLDQQIIAELETAGNAIATTGDITYDIVLEMRELFRQREGRLNEATLLVGTDQEAALLDLEEFKRAEVYGQAVIPSGVLGRVLGIDVVVSTKVAAESYYLFDREAIAFGLQAGPSYSEQGANQFGSQARRAVLDQIFGVKALQVGMGGAAAGVSALIIKDANV